MAVSFKVVGFSRLSTCVEEGVGRGALFCTLVEISLLLKSRGSAYIHTFIFPLPFFMGETWERACVALLDVCERTSSTNMSLSMVWCFEISQV